jgi:anti-anti-sigma factor
LNIEKQQTVGNVTVLALAGEFDAAADRSTLGEIDALIPNCKRLVFNFRELTFMNSSALGYLLKTLKALRDEGGDLVFSEAARSFHNIVEIYGLGHLFKVFPDDRAALAHFGETGDAS